MPARIVTYVQRPQRRKPKEAQAAAMSGSAIVTSKEPSGRHPSAEPPEDPEAEARAKAFFARMIRPGGAPPHDTSK